MRRTRWIGTLALVVSVGGAGVFAAFQNYQPHRPDNAEIARARDGRGRFGREGVVTLPPCHSIECGVTTADEAGNWWLIKADGTMLASSSLTMSNQGAATTSPLGFTGGAGSLFKSGTASFPTTGTNFSVVVVLNAADYSAGSFQTLVGSFDSVDYRFWLSANTSQIEWDIKSDTGVTSVTYAHHVQNTWFGCGATYTSSSGTGTMRCQATNSTPNSSATSGIRSASGNAHTVGGSGNGGARFTGSMRGVFYTEKVLSTSDIDRIVNAAL